MFENVEREMATFFSVILAPTVLHLTGSIKRGTVIQNLHQLSVCVNIHGNRFTHTLLAVFSLAERLDHCLHLTH